MTAWTERLNDWGLEITQRQLAETLWTAADRYGRFRNAALEPFQPYYEYCGTSQGWKMFVGPHRKPTRLHIDIHEGGQWHPIYLQGSREYDWPRSRLSHEHWRTAIFTMVYYQHDDTLRQFAEWAARHVKPDFPDADKIRVRVFTRQTPSPTEVKTGVERDGVWQDAITIAL